MTNSLKGKTAVVTGASSGIGKATVEKLAEEGANIVLASRKQSKLEKIAKDLDTQTLVAQTDVTDDKDVESLFEEAESEFGSIDVVVCNAGIGIGDSVEDLSTKRYRKMMSVNTDGMFFTAREAVPYLKETEGNLIFLGSFAGQYPRPGNPVYAATKWWTRGFALSLSGQVGGEGIAVTVVNPTEVRTQFASEDGSAFEERFEEGEVTEPEDIAEAIVFAAKQDSPNTANEIDMYRRDKFTGF